MGGPVKDKSTGQKLSKNQYRRLNKKNKVQTHSNSATPASVEAEPGPDHTRDDPTNAPAPVVSQDDPLEEVVSEAPLSALDIDENDPLFSKFRDVISRFEQPDKEDAALKDPDKPAVFYDDDNDDVPEELGEEEEPPTLSKTKRKKQNTLSVAMLKQIVSHPELVDFYDVNARDPVLAVELRAQRNVVPAPAHWSQKREYLSSKRGIEKPPYTLPPYLAALGLAEMRDAALQQRANSSLKQQQRERVAPKMGKLDLDYGALWDAFMRRQTKPTMSSFGNVYYEGKEYETNMKHLRPGELSEELKEALNIPPGAPPPWLINQQRFGPPPSYPTLKIPGLNAPPPPGGSWGFHAGGYGKPPIDEFQRPLYGGEIFGTAPAQHNQEKSAPINKTLWGTVAVPEEDEGDEEESDEDDEDKEPDEDEMAAGLRSQSGIRTSSGLTSMTPSEVGGTQSIRGDFKLRKEKRGTETEESVHPRSAGQVIPETQQQTTGFFGSDRGYNLKGGVALDQEERGTKRKAGDIDVSVDMDALVREGKLSKEDMQKQYEAQRKAEASGQWASNYDEDLSQMIAEEGAKRLKKDQERKTKR